VHNRDEKTECRSNKKITFHWDDSILERRPRIRNLAWHSPQRPVIFTALYFTENLGCLSR
jgi:hypothetical protein